MIHILPYIFVARPFTSSAFIGIELELLFILVKTNKNIY